MEQGDKEQAFESLLTNIYMYFAFTINSKFTP